MTPILANVGVPMIFPQLMLMALAFAPVVLVEALLVRKAMGLTFGRALRDVAVANLWTTVLGVPLAWAFMFILELIGTGGAALAVDSPARLLVAVTSQAAWLGPYEGHLVWMVPAAATVLLLPCFVASLLIERWVLSRRWADRDRKAVFGAVLRANVWSYVFLFLAGSLWTGISFK